jgi:hypothetical protein
MPRTRSSSAKTSGKSKATRRIPARVSVRKATPALEERVQVIVNLKDPRGGSVQPILDYISRPDADLLSAINLPRDLEHIQRSNYVPDEWSWWIVVLFVVASGKPSCIPVVEALFKREPELMRRSVMLRYRTQPANRPCADDVDVDGYERCHLMVHLLRQYQNILFVEKLLSVCYPFRLSDALVLRRQLGIGVFVESAVLRDLERVEELTSSRLIFRRVFDQNKQYRVLVGTYLLIRASECVDYYATYRGLIIHCANLFNPDQARTIARDICNADARLLFPSSCASHSMACMLMILDFPWDWAAYECKRMLAELLYPFKHLRVVRDIMCEKGVPVDRLLKHKVSTRIEWREKVIACLGDAAENV